MCLLCTKRIALYWVSALLFIHAAVWYLLYEHCHGIWDIGACKVTSIQRNHSLVTQEGEYSTWRNLTYPHVSELGHVFPCSRKYAEQSVEYGDTPCLDTEIFGICSVSMACMYTVGLIFHIVSKPKKNHERLDDNLRQEVRPVEA